MFTYIATERGRSPWFMSTDYFLFRYLSPPLHSVFAFVWLQKSEKFKTFWRAFLKDTKKMARKRNRSRLPERVALICTTILSIYPILLPNTQDYHAVPIISVANHSHLCERCFGAFPHHNFGQFHHASVEKSS